MNRHDRWVEFRDANVRGFRETGLPERVWASRERLFRLLEFGAVDGEGATLAGLTDGQLETLTALATAFSPDSHDHKFPALLRERVARSGRYG
jgi:hypothetical protein